MSILQKWVHHRKGKIQGQLKDICIKSILTQKYAWCTFNYGTKSSIMYSRGVNCIIIQYKSLIRVGAYNMLWKFYDLLLNTKHSSKLLPIDKAIETIRISHQHHADVSDINQRSDNIFNDLISMLKNNILMIELFIKIGKCQLPLYHT